MPLQNRDPLTHGGGELSSSTAGLQSCECPSGSLALAACCLYSHTRTACWKRPKHIYIRTPGASCISVPTNVSVSEDKIMLVLGHCQCSKQIRSSLVSLHVFHPREICRITLLHYTDLQSKGICVYHQLCQVILGRNFHMYACTNM